MSYKNRINKSQFELICRQSFNNHTDENQAPVYKADIWNDVRDSVVDSLTEHRGFRMGEHVPINVCIAQIKDLIDEHGDGLRGEQAAAIAFCVINQVD